MADVASHFDAYTWRARVLPVFLVLLPASILVALWLPKFNLFARVASFIAAPFGVAMLISQIGQDKGLAKQAALWCSWGGAPTTQLLRHRNEKANPMIRASIHRKLSSIFPDLKIPTADEETANPSSADQTYEQATRYMIAQTRDSKHFPLVFQENINYGFRRNLWGLKAYGIALAVAGTVGSVLRLFIGPESTQFRGEGIVGTAICTTFLLFWIFWATPSWVRIPAEAYAERLFESCDQLIARSRTAETAH